MRPLLLFDGDCGFCTSASAVAERLARGRVDVVPWQSADLDAVGLTPQECDAALQWVDERGPRAGAQAVAALLVARGGPLALPGRVLQLPGVRRVAAAVYEAVSRNRQRLPGGTPACRRP